MDNREYKMLREQDLKGRKVRTLTDLQNGFVRIPAGTVLRIERKMKGLGLIGDPCPHCGIQPVINAVSPYSVELLPPEVPHD